MGQKSVATLLAQIRLSSERVRRLERDYKRERMRAMRERDEALCAAADVGASLTVLVEASTLSRPRVKQVIEEDRWR